VANYFSIYKGTENGMAKLMVPLSGICHPSLERALDFIKDAWEEVLSLAHTLLYMHSHMQQMGKHLRSELHEAVLVSSK